jgi:polyhydroxybutyrate depolymerase
MNTPCFSLLVLFSGACHTEKVDTESTDHGATPQAPTEQSTTNTDDSANPTTPLSPGLTTLWITQEIDGEDVEREVLIAAPNTLSSETYPVVFAFHGATGENNKFVSQMEHLVQDGAFVGVYPQGHHGYWALGVEPSNADDVAFIDAIIAELETMEQIDVEHMYAVGISNGAGISHRAAIQTTHFRAFVAMSTALTVSPVPDSSTHPVSVLQIMGMEDGLCPYDGGETTIGHTFMPAEESVATWATAIGCTGEGTLDVRSNGDRWLSWSDCPDDREVVGIGLANVGHRIPDEFNDGLMTFVWNFLRTH